ncbi:MAG TPA: DNA topoisomerase IB [Candidatus Limnocylindria bacterium]|nr:DNA topoisomerase IB [Candidatus Limnocylindria bacterium]
MSESMTILERLQTRGIRRSGSAPRGFRYRAVQGGAISAKTRERIAVLKIPPGWSDVVVSADAGAAVQAAGRDRAGRWQYLYHAGHVQKRGKRKLERLVRFIEALPNLRRVMDHDLKATGLPRERVLACIVRVLSTCFLRPGSKVYATENGSFGIATLRRRHVDVRGTQVRFDFEGKSQQRQTREIRDARVAKVVRALIAIPGHEVFKFIGEDGQIVDVRRRHINAYIKEVMGDSFSAKDFRTWAGTLICACVLARDATSDAAANGGTQGATSARKRERRVRDAVKETARHLGNTPAVCRSSYIDGSILAHYQRGRMMNPYFDIVSDLASQRSRRLERCEAALLKLLRQKAA